MSSIVDSKGYNQGFKPSKSLTMRTLRRCEYIEKVVAEKQYGKILEIGCGTGQLAYMLAERTRANVFAIDISSEFIIAADRDYKRPNLKYMAYDFSNPMHLQQLETIGCFSAVVGNGILHHLYYHLEDSLKKIYSLLEKDGKICFLEPNFFNPYCLVIFNIGLFRKLAKLDPEEMTFTRDHIKKILLKVGFRNVIVEYRDFLIPGIPDALIKPSIWLGSILERIPVMNMLAQSIYISAEK